MRKIKLYLYGIWHFKIMAKIKLGIGDAIMACQKQAKNIVDKDRAIYEKDSKVLLDKRQFRRYMNHLDTLAYFNHLMHRYTCYMEQEKIKLSWLLADIKKS